jgi:hypothetical protein
MHWAAIVFGWPAAFTAIIVSTAGLVLRLPALVSVGAVVGFPFMYYLYATPRFWPFAAVAVPCHFAAAVFLIRHPRVAWVLFLPTPLLTWCVAAVITRG